MMMFHMFITPAVLLLCASNAVLAAPSNLEHRQLARPDEGNFKNVVLDDGPLTPVGSVQNVIAVVDTAARCRLSQRVRAGRRRHYSRKTHQV